MLFDAAAATPDPLRRAIEDLYRADETEVVDRLLKEARLGDQMNAAVADDDRVVTPEAADGISLDRHGIDRYVP